MIHVIQADLPGTDNLIESEEVQNQGQKKLGEKDLNTQVTGTEKAVKLQAEDLSKQPKRTEEETAKDQSTQVMETEKMQITEEEDHHKQPKQTEKGEAKDHHTLATETKDKFKILIN